MIARTIDGGHSHGRLVGICGGVAGDPQAVPILVVSVWTS
jgi:phosphocarrier protein FPr